MDKTSICLCNKYTGYLWGDVREICRRYQGYSIEISIEMSKLSM